MSRRDMAKAKVDQALGRAEELLGEAYGEDSAQLHGEAVRLRGEAEEVAELDAERSAEQATARRKRFLAEEAADHGERTGG